MKIPKIVGDYVKAYIPKPDVYRGRNTEHFTTDTLYEKWLNNDHCIIKGDDGRWHGFGITNPVLPGISNLHEGDCQNFHCVTEVGNFADLFKEDCFEDKEKIPFRRDAMIEGNSHINVMGGSCPAIIKKDDLWYMIYGPYMMRCAVSYDLYNWTPIVPALFTDERESRDPHIRLENGVYYLTYCIDEKVALRTSTDLINWSERTIIFEMTQNGQCESPFMIKHEDWYYLIWCIWDNVDKTADAYDDRCFVYASKTPFDFKNREPVAMIQAHAPEFIVDEKGDYYISSAHKPYRGINMAKIEWVELEEN